MRFVSRAALRALVTSLVLAAGLAVPSNAAVKYASRPSAGLAAPRGGKGSGRLDRVLNDAEARAIYVL